MVWAVEEVFKRKAQLVQVITAWVIIKDLVKWEQVSRQPFWIGVPPLKAEEPARISLHSSKRYPLLSLRTNNWRINRKRTRQQKRRRPRWRMMTVIGCPHLDRAVEQVEEPPGKWRRWQIAHRQQARKMLECVKCRMSWRKRGNKRKNWWIKLKICKMKSRSKTFRPSRALHQMCQSMMEDFRPFPVSVKLPSMT